MYLSFVRAKKASKKVTRSTMWLQSQLLWNLEMAEVRLANFLLSAKDPLRWAADWRASAATSRRIGIHTSIAGGVENAAERAFRLGCNTFQIFSGSPRQWRPYALGHSQCEAMSALRRRYDLKPLVIHSNYLVNLAGTNSGFLKK
jgi:hypothetical protein